MLKNLANNSDFLFLQVADDYNDVYMRLVLYYYIGASISNAVC